jgi:Flp pilus assembly protein TadD
MPLPSRVTPPAAFFRHQETALFGQAVTFHQAGQLADAKIAYEALLRISPSHAEALRLLGTLLLQQGVPSEAIRLLDLSLRADPRQPQTHNARGVAQFELQRFAAALADFDRAIILQLPEAHKNRASALTSLARYDEALAEFDKATAIDPTDAEIYNNRVPALLWRGDYQAALANFDRAIALRPDYAHAYFQKAQLLLLLDDFANGWKLFEWRWKLSEAQTAYPAFPQPLWLGTQEIAGKMILLHAEQGFGDTLQFCRYVTLVEALGAKVVLQVPPALMRLMTTVRGASVVVTSGDPVPPCDFQCPLMSLPLALGTTPATIPAAVPYLTTDPTLAAGWSTRFGVRTRPRVGLVWFGSRAGAFGHLKSMAFEEILRLTDCDADFYALQKDAGSGGDVALQKSDKVTDLGPSLNDFADTAAAIMQLDLVISIDTAVAHLAGALGKPVWIMLSHMRDWRWLREGTTTPWYPTAKLFRQTRPNDWIDVIDAVKSELNRLTG